MESLMGQIRGLAEAESRRAAGELDTAARWSAHETYALMKEQLEKAQEDVTALEERIGCFWGEVKNGGLLGYGQIAKEIQYRAEYAAFELIRAAAIARRVAEKGASKNGDGCI